MKFSLLLCCFSLTIVLTLQIYLLLFNRSLIAVCPKLLIHFLLDSYRSSVLITLCQQVGCCLRMFVCIRKQRRSQLTTNVINQLFFGTLSLFFFLFTIFFYTMGYQITEFRLLISIDFWAKQRRLHLFNHSLIGPSVAVFINDSRQFFNAFSIYHAVFRSRHCIKLIDDIDDSSRTTINTTDVSKKKIAHKPTTNHLLRSNLSRN